ncbi:hypothetical protein EUX98_g7416 [Antrodiella citrinella]|uniref:Uncharacterized protein n=1 Tax=Antrodiella citrinella TaxID=2447956 RepID=A0A4S4MTY1_9APHY|nr:hypothetical protein EUX98_g7416 [Antrodiella citrinella]
MNALKVLQNSATMQALMKKESQNEVIVKREEMEASLDSIPITSAPEPSPPKRLKDIRRQMTALRAQEDSLIERLKKISPSAVAAQLSSAEKTKESNSIALSDLETEREKRKRAEEVWEDARKEYRAPLVVPAMLDAFEKLAQIAGDALISTSSSASSTAYAPSEASHSQASNRWGPRKPII